MRVNLVGNSQAIHFEFVFNKVDGSFAFAAQYSALCAGAAFEQHYMHIALESMYGIIVRNT